MAKRKHRGRIQAQGGGLEASESWAQDKPLKAKKGLSLLKKLKEKIPAKEAEKRAKEFDKAADLIERLEDGGGVDAHFSKSFRKKGSDVRVDIEVLGGRAFVCIVIAILFFLWLFFK